MSNKIGVWFIGAYGSVATTAIIGAQALAKNLIEPIGLITEVPEVKEKASPIPFGQIVFGGHEISRSSFKQSLAQLDQTGINVQPQLLAELTDDLKKIEKDIKPGVSIDFSKSSQPLAPAARRLSNDIINFRKRHSLDRVIVVNLASTEPPIVEGNHTKTLDGFESALKNRADSMPLLAGRPVRRGGSALGMTGLRASSIYAYAAFKAGCPYINFTPSAGASIPALQAMAREYRLPHCGSDGKTGETLVKSALAAMFNYRALDVLTWQGYNILGNMDGKVLSDPAARQSKILSKDKVLTNILRHKPDTHVGIDYVPSLGEWKTAWDFIHFQGFLGVKMSMQFIWQGCDSILAAPLVLDLIRLMDLAHRRGEFGVQPQLALFFKNPMGTEVSDLHDQWQMFTQYLSKIHNTTAKSVKT